MPKSCHQPNDSSSSQCVKTSRDRKDSIHLEQSTRTQSSLTKPSYRSLVHGKRRQSDARRITSAKVRTVGEGTSRSATQSGIFQRQNVVAYGLSVTARPWPLPERQLSFSSGFFHSTKVVGRRFLSVSRVASKPLPDFGIVVAETAYGR